MHECHLWMRDVDQLIPLGCHLAKARANRDQQINLFAQPFAKVGNWRDAYGADVVVVPVVHIVLTAKGRGHRQTQPFCKSQCLLRTALTPAGTAHHQHRAFGAGNHRLQRLDILCRRCRACRRCHPKVSHRDLIGQHVLRQRQDHRTGAT